MLGLRNTLGQWKCKFAIVSVGEKTLQEPSKGRIVTSLLVVSAILGY
jgi:hypothetical protein